MIQAFIDCLVRPKDCDAGGGAFGKVDHYYATTEHNGRVILHAHGLLWLKGNIGMDSLKNRIINDAVLGSNVVAYIESIIKNVIDSFSSSAITGNTMS